MKSFYLTHNVKMTPNGRSTALDSARAICDEINKSLGDCGRTTEDDCRAEIENIDPELVSLYGIHIESIEVQE